jgi:Holliday junction resolvase RusA-like endonuclease
MKFIIPIEPKAQMRVRFCNTGRTYKAKGQKLAEESIMAFLSRYQPAEPMDGPLLLGVKAFLPIPRSKPQKFKKAALAGIIRPTVKPDLDNLLKNIKDCMTAMGFWGDDKQVVGYIEGTGKYYSTKPRWEVLLLSFNSEQEKSTCC